MYPFLHNSTVSCYRSMEYYLFDGESTRVNNNVYIHESTTGASNASEEATATSRRSSTEGSIESIHLDYTNTAAHNWTAEELLAEEIKASARRHDEATFEPTKSQRFWSDSLPAEPDPFAFSDHPSDSSGNDDGGNEFRFPTTPGCPGNQKNSSNQGDTPGTSDTVADTNPPKPSLKVALPLDSGSSLNSDFSDMSFVPPTGSVSEKFPKFSQGNTPHLMLNVCPAVASPFNITDTPGPYIPVKPAGTSKPSGVSIASKPAPAPGSSKSITTAGEPATTAGTLKPVPITGFSKPNLTAVLSKPTVPDKPADVFKHSRTTQIASRSNALKPFEKKDSLLFDGHITPPEQPEFPRRPFSRADELARFATKKQSVNDFADQMGAFLKRIASGNLPKSNTTADSKEQTSTTGVKPPSSHNDTARLTQHLSEQASKRAPPKADTVSTTRAQRAELSPFEKLDKPNLAQQEPSNIKADAPLSLGPLSSSTKTGSSLTEVVANAPFMPRKKIQLKAAPTTVKLSFSRFKADLDDFPNDASNVAVPILLSQNQASCAPGSSTASSLPFSAFSTNNKRKVYPKSSLSSEPQFAYIPGSLRSPSANSTSQVKRAPVFTSSFQHLKGASGIHIASDVPARRNHGAPSENIKAAVDTISSTTPEVFGYGDSKISTLPSSLIGKQLSLNTDQALLEAGLALDQLHESYLATALDTDQPLNFDENFSTVIAATDVAQPLNPDSSPVALSMNSRVNAGSSGSLAAAFLASNLYGSRGGASHISERNGNVFESVELLAAGTIEPPVATTHDDKESYEETQLAVDLTSTSASSAAALSDQSSITSTDATRRYSLTIPKREALRVALMKTEKYAQNLAAGAYIPPPASGTPLYFSFSSSAGAAGAESSATSQQYAASSIGAGSGIDRLPILLADTEHTTSGQEADTNETVCNPLSYQPAEKVEAHPPEGLLQSLKNKTKEQMNQKTSQQGKAKIKNKGKGKSNKKKKRKRR
ncbi:hypothetical protein MAM1_0017d01563 [Mucor ambiguus]|uniref:Uncharacterized protein n=1 Tax=Mucor ambiguus TaxID=91626 RepID=A0A0C9MJT1_9FUNG|nr:hypothetical protein MAM1_0017d01563 [Mucor ambiguus]